MDQLLKLAQSAGMSKEQGEKATAGIFGLLKNQLPPDQYKMVQDKFPEADGMVAEQAKRSGGEAGGGGGGGGGGFMGAAMGALGGSKDGGATSVTSLLATLASAGITPDKAQQFLTTAAPHIQKVTGIDVTSMLGGGGGGAAPSNPMGKMMGMFGK